jgi:hypothetical protein
MERRSRTDPRVDGSMEEGACMKSILGRKDTLARELKTSWHAIFLGSILI